MNASPAGARIGAKELIATMTLFVAANAFLAYPQYVSASGLEAAWMEPLIAGGLTIIVFLLLVAGVRRWHPGADLTSIAGRAFGRIGGAVVACLFATYFVLSTALVMRQFTENVITTVLPSTPIMAIGGLFTLAVCIVAQTGLEGVVRTAFILQPLLIGGIVAVCLLTANWWHPSTLLPIFGSGPVQVAWGAVRTSGIFGNVLLLLLIYPHARDARALRTAGLVSITLATALLFIFVLGFHLVFSAQQADKVTFPLYEMARMIYLGRYVQHVESVFVFLWVTAAVLKMSISLWAVASLLGDAFSWPAFQPMLPALCMLSFALSLFPDNVNSVTVLERDWLFAWGWTVVFAVPAFVILAGALRRADPRAGPPRRRGGATDAASARGRSGQRRGSRT